VESLIQSSGIQGFGLGVNLEHFREVAAMPEAHDNPNWNPDYYDVGFQMIIGRIADILVRIQAGTGEHHVAGFVCDESPKSRKIENSYHRFKKKHPDLAEHMRGISHLDDKINPPLQMADLMADVAREMVTEWLDLGDPSKQASCPLPGSVMEVKIWDRDGMIKQVKGEISPIV